MAASFKSLERDIMYILFDLEATCWGPYDRKPMDATTEVIEIGAVKINKNLEVVSEFCTFIKPSINPRLSSFCTELTTIEQKDVDNAPYFQVAISNFMTWAKEGSHEDPMFLSWGAWDKQQLVRESVAKGCEKYFALFVGDSVTPYRVGNHIDFKRAFARTRNIKPCGMERALSHLNIPLDGTHHRGIDDAKNISKIFVVAYPELVQQKYIEG